MSAPKKGDRVLLKTPWSEQSVQRARVTRVGTESYGVVWETGELKDREANVERASFEVVEVLR